MLYNIIEGDVFFYFWRRILYNELVYTAQFSSADYGQLSIFNYI